MSGDWTHWRNVQGAGSVLSPALLIDADAVERNIAAMLAIVDHQAEWLCPHVKTHKMSAVLQMQRDAGIETFKASTLTEARMVAAVGGARCLLAHPPVGPKVAALIESIASFPATQFQTIVDDLSAARVLNDALAAAKFRLPVLIDVDAGMHRTGVPFGRRLETLRSELSRLPRLDVVGLHVYDGHLHQTSLDERRAAAETIRLQIEAAISIPFGDEPPQVVVSGSPTFAYWAEVAKTNNRLPDSALGVWQCSPGTMVLWDCGYAEAFPEMDYELAAALVVRVISKPGSGRLCLDLGHKSVASEMPLEQRIWLPELPDARLVGHSEEHLIVETEQAASIPVGCRLWAFPRHICPTVALYDQAVVVRGGQVSGERWNVDARGRGGSLDNTTSADGGA